MNSLYISHSHHPSPIPPNVQHLSNVFMNYSSQRLHAFPELHIITVCSTLKLSTIQSQPTNSTSCYPFLPTACNCFPLLLAARPICFQLLCLLSIAIDFAFALLNPSQTPLFSGTKLNGRLRIIDHAVLWYRIPPHKVNQGWNSIDDIVSESQRGMSGLQPTCRVIVSLSQCYFCFTFNRTGNLRFPVGRTWSKSLQCRVQSIICGDCDL